ncbi:hypothetical protein SPPR111872_01970 [Sphingobacterium prati]
MNLERGSKGADQLGSVPLFEMVPSRYTICLDNLRAAYIYTGRRMFTHR